MKFGIREIVVILVIMAIPVLAWWFVLRPNAERSRMLAKQIDAKQTKLRELNKATATIGDLEKEIEALGQAVSFFRSKLPSEKEMDKVLQETWRLAELNAMATKSIRTGAVSQEAMLVEPGGPFAEQPITMQFEGPFNGFYGFMLALEVQPRILRVREMKIEKPQKGPEGVIKADCAVTVFFERGGGQKELKP